MSGKTMSIDQSPAPASRGDRVALGLFGIAGAVMAVWSIVAAIQRIVAVLTDKELEVLAHFLGTPATAPIGVDGAAVTVELEQAVLTVSGLPAASVAAIVIQQVLMAATVVTVVASLLLLAVNMIRRRVFSRRNTVVVSTAGIVGVLGFAAYPFFGNMAANGAFAVLSERTFDNVIMTVDVSGLLMIGFIAALASTVFAVGERLQRDTEGLV